MQRRIFAISVVAFFGLAHPSFAEESFQAGYWKMTTIAEEDGKVVAVPEKTVCFKEKPEFTDFFPHLQTVYGCKRQDWNREGSKTMFRVVCTGEQKGETSITTELLTKAHLKIEARYSNADGRKTEMKIDAMRIGECPN